MDVTHSSVYLGGRFETVAGHPAPYLAAFDLPSRLADPLHLNNGRFRLNFFGPLGHYYVFEASTDLTIWTSVFTNRAPITFEDVTSLAYPQRFYRARPLK